MGTGMIPQGGRIRPVGNQPVAIRAVGVGHDDVVPTVVSVSRDLEYLRDHPPALLVHLQHLVMLPVLPFRAALLAGMTSIE